MEGNADKPCLSSAPNFNPGENVTLAEGFSVQRCDDGYSACATISFSKFHNQNVLCIDKKAQNNIKQMGNT